MKLNIEIKRNWYKKIPNILAEKILGIAVTYKIGKKNAIKWQNIVVFMLDGAIISWFDR